MIKPSGALLVVLLVLASGPASAAPGDYSLVLRALRDQFASRPVEAPAAEEECRKEALSALLRQGLEPYLADRDLGLLDPETRLEDVAKARGRTLRALPVMDLVGAYAAAEGDKARFARQLRLLAQARKLSLAWTDPPVERAVDRVYRLLHQLDGLNFSLVHSARYDKAGWMVDLRSAWYPLSGTVHLFVVGTSSCEGASTARSGILNLAGRVRPNPDGGYVVHLDEPVFEVRCCETRLSGEWTDSAAGLPEAVVASSLSLKVVGLQVRGRLVQIVAGRSASGQALRGKVVYVLEGRLEAGEVVQGTLQATGDPAASSLLTGRSATTLSGTWSGRLASGQAEGVFSVEGGRPQVWKARVVEPREPGS